jgi:hypothetical protein
MNKMAIASRGCHRPAIHLTNVVSGLQPLSEFRITIGANTEPCRCFFSFEIVTYCDIHAKEVTFLSIDNLCILTDASDEMCV